MDFIIFLLLGLETDEKMRMFKARFKRDYPAKNNHNAVPKRLQVSANAEGALMSGYLHKRARTIPKWKKLWFVVKDRVLYIYKASEDTVAAHTVPILGFDLDFDIEVLRQLRCYYLKFEPNIGHNQ